MNAVGATNVQCMKNKQGKVDCRYVHGHAAHFIFVSLTMGCLKTMSFMATGA